MKPSCLLSFVLLLAGAGPGLAASTLAPHRAVYDLALDKASDRSGITGIQGRMVYEFNGNACEGYTVKFRFVTQINTSDVSRLTDQQTTTFEDGEGKVFNFVTKSFVDQNLDKELKGVAKSEKGRIGVAIEKPARQTLDLQGSFFPTQHLIDLIERAKRGDTFYETTLFDGSEDADKVMSTTVVVGKKTAPGEADPEKPALNKLAQDSYWPVDIAYFDTAAGGGEETPQYRISFKLYENGVTRDLTMDYGDFSMTGKLVDLSLFDPPKTDCRH